MSTTLTPLEKPSHKSLRLSVTVISFLLASGSFAATPETPAQSARWNCSAGDIRGWQCDAGEPGTTSHTLHNRYQPLENNQSKAGSAKQADKQITAQTVQSKTKPANPPAPALTKKTTKASIRGKYAHLDWVEKNQLSEEQLRQMPGYCSGAYLEPEFVDPALRLVDPASQPILTSSKESETTDQGYSTLTGDVIVQQGFRKITGEQAVIDRAAGSAQIIGEARYREPGILLIGNDSQVNIESKEVTIADAKFVSHKTHMRGAASRIDRNQAGQIQIMEGEITRCEPGVESWVLSANKIKLNQATGVGIAKHAKLKIRNVPVFYTPYLQFPIDSRRKSGLLFPQIGSSDDGLDLATPFYWNIAPNYDATITPRYISDRGTGAELEFRYLHKKRHNKNQGVLGGAWLSSDKDFDNQDRWLGTVEHRGKPFSKISTYIDYSTVSDERYFSDLGTGLDVTSQTHLRRLGQASYNTKFWSLTARASGYQTLDLAIADINKPYDQLPQILLNALYPHQKSGFEFGLKVNYSYFDRDNDNLTGLARAVGHRIKTEPSISWNFELPYAYLKPTVKYKQIDYSLNDLDSSLEDSPNISAPVYSLDSGLFFERDSQILGKNYTQTLEPRLFYLKVPEDQNQDLAPDFDTSELTFSYDQLFRDDRFVGGDRIGDADQLSIGLTTRHIEASGFERFRASIGQTYYFADRRVTLSGVTGIEEQQSESAYAAQFQFALKSGWRITGDIEWDQEQERTNESSLSLRYRRDNNHIFNMGYRVRKDRQRIEQSDVSLIWPLSDRWRVIARWNQDLINNRVVEALAGLEYQSCCWSVKVAARRWINDSDIVVVGDIEEKEGVYIQFELKGLAGIGSSLESLLTKSITGYREQSKNDLFRQ